MADWVLLPLDSIRTVGLAGAGVVGSGWAALLLSHGFDVIASDPSPGAEQRLRNAVADRWPALREMNVANGEPPLERIRFASTLAEMAAHSDLVHENGPENPTIKGEILAQIDAHLPRDRLIVSSSGGVPPSALQMHCRTPQRVLVGHPFHPAHIIPLVEVVGGQDSLPEAVDLAMAYFRRLGKKPIRIKREMVGHLVNRLQFSLLREAAFCLSEDVASATDIDEALRWGLGPRWTLMGALMTWNLAGGDSGLEGLIDRFAGDMQRWWDALGEPTLDPKVREALIAAAKELRGSSTNAQWAQCRDAALVAFSRFAAEHPYPGDMGSSGGSR